MPRQGRGSAARRHEDLLRPQHVGEWSQADSAVRARVALRVCCQQEWQWRLGGTQVFRRSVGALPRKAATSPSLLPLEAEEGGGRGPYAFLLRLKI